MDGMLPGIVFMDDVSHRIHFKNHILKGVSDFQSPSSLYRTSPLAADCQVLMAGEIPDTTPEPCVWTRTYKGGNIVYIGLGRIEDFRNPIFLELVANSIFWAVKREPTPLEKPGVGKEPFPSERLKDLTPEEGN